jgi:flagellar assembly factor FliW
VFFRPDYEVVLSDIDVERLLLNDESIRWVYVTGLDSAGQAAMTANLLAPIVINGNARRGRQVILDDERYTTRHPILQEMWRLVQTQEAAG